MIVLASLLFAQAATATYSVPATLPVPMVGIEALGERMAATGASLIQTNEGGWRCNLSATTGIAYIDERLCQANVHCSLRHGNDPEKIGGCLEDRRKGILKDYRKAQQGEA